MPDWSRRRALHAVGTIASVALAGCTEGRETSDPPSRRRGDPVTEYDLLAVRDSDASALFWRDETADEEDPERMAHVYATADSDLEDVSFASNSEAADTLSAFANGTDFEARSLLLRARPVAECYAAQFRGVWRDGDDLETAFCQKLRPADEACGREAEDTFAYGLRLPYPDEELTSFGSQWSGDCHPTPPVGVDDAGTQTTGGGGDD